MTDWQPTASNPNLRLRADLLKKLRTFFAARQVLEVETPALSQTGATDRNIASFQVPQAGGLQPVSPDIA